MSDHPGLFSLGIVVGMFIGIIAMIAGLVLEKGHLTEMNLEAWSVCEELSLAGLDAEIVPRNDDPRIDCFVRDSRGVLHPADSVYVALDHESLVVRRVS